MKKEMRRRDFLKRCILVPYIGFVGLSSMALAAESTVQRRLRFTLTFKNPLDRALNSQKFWCYLPASVTPSQELRGVNVSMPHQVREDLLGHRILELEFDHFSALAQKVVTVTVDVELEQKPRPQPLESTQSWLQPERFMESDNSAIKALAAQLNQTKPRDTVHSIYEWVRHNLVYAGYIAEDLGALYAVTHRQGDCTEYADLVVALARAGNIPARMVGGYVVDRDSTPRPQDYHNWAEVYLEGTWSLVDAQKGVLFNPADQYVTFRIYRDNPTNDVGLAHRYRVLGDFLVTF